MTHLSPAVFGMWSVSSVLLTTFCFYHIWHYDRFRCLRLNHCLYSGTFKRLMTYTYVLSLSLITIYSVGNAVIKYREGFVFEAGVGVFPKPYTQWTKAHQDAIFPLVMLFAIGFSLEMITHLEELCFWFFLMNATASPRGWFRSSYFIIWSCGSVIALVYIPTVAAVFRHDPLKDEAYIFLAGGIGSLTLTLFFVPVLYLFPAFMRGLVRQGVDKSSIMHLKKFHELNRLRIFFRLLFLIPLVVLGIDGSKPHGHPINESMFWTDIFGMIAAFGCIVSSAITLLIFFPRNDDNEYEYSSLGRLDRLEALQWKGGRHYQLETPEYYSERNRPELTSKSSLASLPILHTYVQHPFGLASRHEVGDGYGALHRYPSPRLRNHEFKLGHDRGRSTDVLIPPPSAVSSALLRPNRLGSNGDVELGSVQDLPMTGVWAHNWTYQFKSPLDVMQSYAY